MMSWVFGSGMLKFVTVHYEGQVTISMVIAHQPVVAFETNSCQLQFLDLQSKPLVQE